MSGFHSLICFLIMYGWNKTIVENNPNRFDSVEVIGNNNIFAVGWSDPPDGTSYRYYHVTKFNSTGYEYTQAEGWNISIRLRDDRNCEAKDIAADTENNIIVAGNCWDTFGDDSDADWWINKFN